MAAATTAAKGIKNYLKSFHFVVFCQHIFFRPVFFNPLPVLCSPYDYRLAVHYRVLIADGRQVFYG
jgi:hypothetical protein